MKRWRRNSRTDFKDLNGSVGQAIDLYETFHQFEPHKIKDFHPSFQIPDTVYHVGEAIEMFYYSDKLNPETGEDEGWIGYFHEHEGGVQIYLTDPKCGGDPTDVPYFIKELNDGLADDVFTGLSRIGDCEGWIWKDLEGKKREAEGTDPLPEWYAIPSGRALLVIQSKRKVLAILWGGTLDVEDRGVVG